VLTSAVSDSGNALIRAARIKPMVGY
jgi:hypothetical protein